MNAYTPPSRPEISVSVLVNGARLADWELHCCQDAERRRIFIPGSVLRRKVDAIVFEIRDPLSPLELGRSSDPRHLGLMLHTLSLQAAGKPESQAKRRGRPRR